MKGEVIPPTEGDRRKARELAVAVLTGCGYWLPEAVGGEPVPSGVEAHVIAVLAEAREAGRREDAKAGLAMTSPPPTDPKAMIEELERLEREATARTSKRWVNTTDREDGTAQVYSPSRGPCRVVVPIAETDTKEAPFIVALRNAAPELLKLARRAILEGPIVEACVDWQKRTGDCFFCGFEISENETHGDDCKLLASGRITKEGARRE